MRLLIDSLKLKGTIRNIDERFPIKIILLISVSIVDTGEEADVIRELFCVPVSSRPPGLLETLEYPAGCGDMMQGPNFNPSWLFLLMYWTILMKQAFIDL